MVQVVVVVVVQVGEVEEAKVLALVEAEVQALVLVEASGESAGDEPSLPISWPPMLHDALELQRQPRELVVHAALPGGHWNDAEEVSLDVAVVPVVVVVVMEQALEVPSTVELVVEEAVAAALALVVV